MVSARTRTSSKSTMMSGESTWRLVVLRSDGDHDRGAPARAWWHRGVEETLALKRMKIGELIRELSAMKISRSIHPLICEDADSG